MASEDAFANRSTGWRYGRRLMATNQIGSDDFRAVDRRGLPEAVFMLC